MMEFRLRGRIPCKKNRRKMGSLPASDRAAIAALGFELNAQIARWTGRILPSQELTYRGHRLPLCHPNLAFRFYSTRQLKDKDGMLTTLLDIMTACRLLRDDSIEWCNGHWDILPAVVCDIDGVDIGVSPFDVGRPVLAPVDPLEIGV